MSDIQKQAIQASLDNNWEFAIELNNQILADNPTDISTLNRLARAYLELDQQDSAKTVYQKVLSLDKYNPIALKYLKGVPSRKNGEGPTIAKEDFVEEAGVTKSVSLVKIAAKNILMGLSCKESLKLTPRSRLIAVETESGSYIGCLPDDISLKLKNHLKSGYKYTVCLKSSTDSAATIFIREIHRPNRVTASPTFMRAHGNNS